MDNKTIVVTGISGYFGRVLLPHLERDPTIDRIIGIDRLPPTHSQRSTKLEFHSLDIRDPSISTIMKSADILLHMAFIMWRKPGDQDLDAVNIDGARYVFDAAVEAGVRKIIFTSSVMVYGVHPDNPPLLTEDSPLRPNLDLYYSRAKGACEAHLDELEAQHPNLVITRLRPCGVAGPQAPRKQFEPYVADTAIVASGSQAPGQLLHEEDLAAAVMLAITTDLPGAYNAASAEPSVFPDTVRARGGRVIALPLSVLRALSWLLWRTGQSVFSPDWIDLNRYPFVASSDKLIAAGWTPRYTTAQTYQALYQAFRDGDANEARTEGES
jgi:nucleoside-diphosphate-sugar epimerase